MRFVVKSTLYEEIKNFLSKSDNADSKLAYFKREIIKILEKQENEGNKDITKSLDFIEWLYIEKSDMKVGHISTYKDGSVWKKIQQNPPKWKCIRQGKNFSKESSGAKQSITKLIGKVKNCNSTDELLDIVMFNVDRFRDEKGQILSIVEKLRAEVENKRNDFAIDKELSKTYSKSEAIRTIKEWATQENFNKAKGKSRDEIFFNFGQKLKVIGNIPKKYQKMLNPKSEDTRVFCGKGYFIDHMANHHPEVPLEDYEVIPDVLEHPNDVKLDTKSVPTLIFQKKTAKYGTVVVNCKADGDRVIFYKTGFTSPKEAYKNKPSVADRYPAISPSSAAGNGNISPRPNDNTTIPSSTDSVKQNDKEISDETRKEYLKFAETLPLSSFVSEEKKNEAIDMIHSWIQNKDSKLFDKISDTSKTFYSDLFGVGLARYIFEKETGLKLPKSAKDSRAFMRKWLGKQYDESLRNGLLKSSKISEKGVDSVLDYYSELSNSDKMHFYQEVVSPVIKHNGKDISLVDYLLDRKEGGWTLERGLTLNINGKPKKVDYGFKIDDEGHYNYSPYLFDNTGRRNFIKFLFGDKGIKKSVLEQTRQILKSTGA